MSKKTVKPGLTAKRGKRVVENDQFHAFTRRVLAAYARRVATGDIEALRLLDRLSSDVDIAIQAAVYGLREFGYSWSDIGARLGVSRQAAQMRYGTSTERGALDRRILDAGAGVSLSTLVGVFADQCRGIPAASVCPGCGHQFDPDDVDGDCPTNQVVRPLLQRRKHERLSALAPLTHEQLAELEVKPRRRPRPIPEGESMVGLFNPDPYRRRAGLR
jgi:hypothetical protein